jgi:hypothetical protein
MKHALKTKAGRAADFPIAMGSGCGKRHSPACASGTPCIYV